MRTIPLLLLSVALAGCVDGFEDLSTGPAPHEDGSSTNRSVPAGAPVTNATNGTNATSNATGNSTGNTTAAS